MRFFALVCTLILILALAPAASAPKSHHDFNTAMQMMGDGDYAEAYCHLKPLAEQGDSRAQYSLGWMYHNGYGLRINDEKALAWWTRAAAQQDPDALFALGLLYEQGLGSKKDPYRAASLYIRAMERGNEDAAILIRNHLRKADSSLNPYLLDKIRGQWAILGAPRIISSLNANIRTGPGKRNKVALKLPQDTPVTQLSQKGKWVHIGINGQPRTGWIHESLLGEMPESELSEATP